MKGFFEGKGFYIVLGLCAVAIGVSGYILFFTGPSDSDIAVYEPVNITKEEKVEEKTEDDTLEGDTQLENKVENKVENNDNSTSKKNSVENKPENNNESTSKDNKNTTEDKTQTLYIKPVDGAVINNFSGSELRFNDVMGDWRTHSGTDYKASVGTRVVAISSGSVKEIKDDTLWGTQVTITQKDGITVTYSGLNSKVPVSVGSEVKAGDVLGTSGDNIEVEASASGHIHVSAYKDGIEFDIQELFN